MPRKKISYPIPPKADKEKFDNVRDAFCMILSLGCRLSRTEAQGQSAAAAAASASSAPAAVEESKEMWASCVAEMTSGMGGEVVDGALGGFHDLACVVKRSRSFRIVSGIYMLFDRTLEQVRAANGIPLPPAADSEESDQAADAGTSKKRRRKPLMEEIHERPLMLVLDLVWSMKRHQETDWAFADGTSSETVEVATRAASDFLAFVWILEEVKRDEGVSFPLQQLRNALASSSRSENAKKLLDVIKTPVVVAAAASSAGDAPAIGQKKQRLPAGTSGAKRGRPPKAEQRGKDGAPVKQKAAKKRVKMEIGVDDDDDDDAMLENSSHVESIPQPQHLAATEAPAPGNRKRAAAAAEDTEAFGGRAAMAMAVASMEPEEQQKKTSTRDDDDDDDDDFAEAIEKTLAENGGDENHDDEDADEDDDDMVQVDLGLPRGAATAAAKGLDDAEEDAYASDEALEEAFVDAFGGNLSEPSARQLRAARLAKRSAEMEDGAVPEKEKMPKACRACGVVGHYTTTCTEQKRRQLGRNRMLSQMSKVLSVMEVFADNLALLSPLFNTPKNMSMQMLDTNSMHRTFRKAVSETSAMIAARRTGGASEPPSKKRDVTQRAPRYLPVGKKD